MTSKTILVVGKSGQLARALARFQERSNYAYRCIGRPELDLTDFSLVESAFHAVRPALAVNAAAYTGVDKAESEPRLAHRVNAEGPAHLAGLCLRAEIPLIHVSTDYVFNGARDRPYGVDDPIDPQSIYGATKAAGEDAVRDILDAHIIVRTAWLYSEDGSNFVRTMLRLAREQDVVNVVDDQIGSPTYAADLATAIDAIVVCVLNSREAPGWGTFHATNSGQTSWYGFAEQIFRRAHAFGHPRPVLNPIPSQDFPTLAKRPAYSILDAGRIEQSFGITLPSWQDGLDRCMERIFAAATVRAPKPEPRRAS